MKIAGRRIEYSSPEFKSLFENIFPSICLVAGRLMQDIDAGKDLAQETFIKLWEKSDEDFRNEDALKAYLYVLVKNACLNAIRSERRKKKHAIENAQNLPSNEHVLDEILREETYSLLYKTIEKLAPQTQNIIKLSLFGMTNTDIAERLNVSVNTIKTLKLRAYRTLRNQLGNKVLVLFLFRKKTYSF